MLNRFNVTFKPSAVLVKFDGVNQMVPSMVLSTVLVCALITVMPWAAPIMMNGATNSWT